MLFLTVLLSSILFLHSLALAVDPNPTLVNSTRDLPSTIAPAPPSNADHVMPSLSRVCAADSSEDACVSIKGRSVSRANVTVDLEEKKGGVGGGGRGGGGHGGARPGADGHGGGGKGEGSTLGAGTALILGASLAVMVASTML
jgi:hypothetical protein